VAGDVLLAGRDLVSGAPAVKAAPAGGPLALSPESPSPFFLRLGLADRPGSLAAVAGALARRAISIDRIYQEGGPREASGAVPVRIVTHPASYARVREALAAIRGLGACRREPLLLRVLP
jgi:homoserine dehydrogenase